MEAGLLLVAAIVRQLERTMGRVLSRDDMVSLGNEGLVDAMSRFEPGRGVEFRAYASVRIRGAIIDGMRREALMSRRAYERASEECGDELFDCEPAVEEESDDSPEELIIRAEESRAVREAVKELAPEHAQLVQRFYVQGDSLQEISEDLGYAPGWGSRAMPLVHEAMRRSLGGGRLPHVTKRSPRLAHARHVSTPADRQESCPSPVKVTTPRATVKWMAVRRLFGAVVWPGRAIMGNQIVFQADVNLDNETRGAECFEKTSPALMSLPEASVARVNLDVLTIASTVIGRIPRIRALRAEAAALPGFDATCIDLLEERSYALIYAHNAYLTAVHPDGNLAALRLEAAATRDRLRAEIHSLCVSGLMDPVVLKDYSGNPGFARVAGA